MTCREAERLVMPYINGSITDEELKAFVEHIDHCPDCREELEIYFTVDVGIRQLDEGTGSYNIKGALEYPEESNRRFVYGTGAFQTEDSYAEAFTECHLCSKYPLFLVCICDTDRPDPYLEPDWILRINY